MENLVDLSRIQETCDGDTEFEEELINMYLEDAPMHTSKIADFIRQSDANGVKAKAHTLKRSSANIGARAMMDIAMEIEKAAMAGKLEILPELQQRLEIILGETDTFFRDYVATL